MFSIFVLLSFIITLQLLTRDSVCPLIDSFPIIKPNKHLTSNPCRHSDISVRRSSSDKGKEMNISCAATDLRPSETWWHQSPMFNVHRILMLVRYFHTVYCSYSSIKEGFSWEAFYVGMSVWLSRRFLEIGEFESKCKVAILSVLFFNCRKYKYFCNFGS